MEKFNRVLRGYDPEEVNSFLDQVIKQVESLVNDIKIKDASLSAKDQKILELSKLTKENEELKTKLAQYIRMEETLNRAIMMAQKTSDQMRMAAHNESETIVTDAKRNANRIVNEALLRAEKADMEADMLKRNVNIFKRKLKGIVESQLDVINDIEKVEL